MIRSYHDLISSIRTVHYPKLRSFLLRYVDANQVEDVIQDTCLKAATRLYQLRNLNHFQSWIFMIAKREALQRLRRNRREIQATIIHDLVFDSAAQFDIPQLSEHEELRMLVEGYSIGEIAKMKNLNPGTVKSRIFRSRSTLRMMDQVRLKTVTS